jgi:type I restriction enzyme S subunit
MVIASWKNEPLGSVATLQRGFDLPSRLRKPGAVPIITSSGTEDGHCEAKVKGPGVVTGRYGTIGEVFFVLDDFWPLNTTLYVRDFHGNDPLFISYLLRTIDFHTHSGKSGVPGVNRNDLHEIVVPVPPTKAEQQAIAEVLSNADALIESVEKLIAKKRQIKRGAMQELLTGKKRLPGFGEEWTVQSLGEIGESLIGLTYKPTDVRTDGILVLRSSNIFEGALCFDDNVYVDTEIPENIMVKPGDILICVRNGSRDLIGKCAKIDERAQGMTFGAFMAVFRTPYHPFVYHQFQSDVIKRQIQEHLGATINQITNKSLNSFRIPIPLDASEQTAIAATLSDMDSELAALEVKLAKARMIKQGMMQELLTGKVRLV